MSDKTQTTPMQAKGVPLNADVQEITSSPACAQTAYPCREWPVEDQCEWDGHKFETGGFMGHTCGPNHNGTFAAVLKPSSDYLLMCLAEECAEVIQIASKVYRFGQNDTEPGKSAYNKTRLSQEIGDVLGVVEMLQDAGIEIDESVCDSARIGKKERIMQFMGREKRT